MDVLFIGGFVSHLEIFVELPLAQRFWERMGSFARIVSFDKRGMGLSDREAGAYTLENVVDDALAALDAVGAGAGGGVRRLWGVRRDDARRDASGSRQRDGPVGTLCARVAGAPDYPEGVPLEVPASVDESVLEQWGVRSAVDSCGRRALPVIPQLRDWWARLLRSGGSPRSMRTIGLMYEQLDVRSLLSAVTVPRSCSTALGDRLVPPALSRMVAQRDPGRARGRARGRGPPVHSRRSRGDDRRD